MAESAHKYLPVFIAEASEHLEALSRELVRLEQEPVGGPLWDSIFRRVHSVKGSAATVGLSGIVDIAHAAETLIGKLKLSPAPPDRDQVDLLLQATDALSQEVQRATAELKRGEQNSTSLLTRLADATRALSPVTPPPPPASKPAEKPVVDPALPRLDVFFSLSRACQAPGARALIVQRKLKGLGVLVEMEPPPQQLMQK